MKTRTCKNLYSIILIQKNCINWDSNTAFLQITWDILQINQTEITEIIFTSLPKIPAQTQERSVKSGCETFPKACLCNVNLSHTRIFSMACVHMRRIEGALSPGVLSALLLCLWIQPEILFQKKNGGMWKYFFILRFNNCRYLKRRQEDITISRSFCVN